MKRLAEAQLHRATSDIFKSKTSSSNNFGNSENNAGNKVENVFELDNAYNNNTNNATNNVVSEDDLPQLLDSKEALMSQMSHNLTWKISLAGKIALRLKFSAFKSLEGEKVKETYTSLKILLNELKNKDVKIAQGEVNAMFVSNLPKKWLSMNQTQRANHSIKNESLATLFGKYNYEKELIDQIYESETKKFTIQSSISKALISNTNAQDNNSDVEEDIRSSNEFLADLNAEFYDKALLANQKRF
ncbi:hypothetical protein Tco_0647863 [Tanacetum coccineum]